MRERISGCLSLILFVVLSPLIMIIGLILYRAELWETLRGQGGKWSKWE